MSTYSFGILYWLNPINKELEFIVARKYSKDLPLSLFYHDHEGFSDKLWGDTMGLIDSSSEELGYKIYEEVEPNLKAVVGGHNVYYIYINYVPGLVEAMNGFRTYLDECGTVKTYNNKNYKTIDTCKKDNYNIGSVFYDFQILSANEVSASLDKFNAQSKTALANFSTLLITLKDFQKKGVQSHKMSSTEIQAQLKKNAELKIVNPMVYIDELRKQHEAYQQSLKPKYKESIAYYTGSGYDIINKYLRGQTTLSSINEKTVLNHISNLNQVLNNAPPLTQSIFVYRGIDLDPITKFQKLKEGDVIDLFRDHFNSTSFSLPISGKFAGHVCCLFMLHLSPGTKGLYVGKLSSYSHEDEFILAPGPFFEIIRYKNETVPIKNKWSNKPNLLTYRAACVDCETAYQKYNNIVYYQLVQPAFAVSKTPTTGMFKSPKQSPIDIAGKIMTKKMTKVSTAMLKDPKALVPYSKFTKIDTKPKTDEELKAEKQKAEKQKAEKEKAEKIKELNKENEKLAAKAQQLSSQIALVGANFPDSILKVKFITQIIDALNNAKLKYTNLDSKELILESQILSVYNQQLDDINAQLEKFKKTQPSAAQISTIEQKYLQGLSHEALDELKKLADKCKHHNNNSINHILNTKTGKCVNISGTVGKKVIAELKSQYPMKAPTQPISPKPYTPFPLSPKAQTTKELEVELIKQNDQLISQAQQLHKKIVLLGEPDPSGLSIHLTLLKNIMKELHADKSKYANFVKSELMAEKVKLDQVNKQVANINGQLENFIKTLPPTKPISPKAQPSKELKAELIELTDQLISQAEQLSDQIKSLGSTVQIPPNIVYAIPSLANFIYYLIIDKNKYANEILSKDELIKEKIKLDKKAQYLSDRKEQFEKFVKTQASTVKTISIPTIDSQYLQGLSPEALAELKKMADQCSHYKNNQNKIINKTGKCVNIDGAIGQQIISQLKSQYPFKTSAELKAQKQQAEKQKSEKQKAEQQKAEKQKAEKQKAEKQKAEKQKAEKQKAEKQKAEKLHPETELAIQQLVEKNEQLNSLAQEYINKILALGKNAPEDADYNLALLNNLINQLTDLKSQYAKLWLGEIPYEHQTLNDIKTQIDDLGQEITTWKKIATGLGGPIDGHKTEKQQAEKQLPQASTVYIPTINSKYLQGLSTEALLQIQKMAFNCLHINEIKTDDGYCVHVGSKEGQKVIEQLNAKYPIEAKTVAAKSDISIPNIDNKYLDHLSQPVLIELKKLAEGCPHNKFKNPSTQTCVKIDGTVAKKIIKELIQKTQTQSPAKVCGIPKNQPVVKKPLLLKKPPSNYVISPSDIESPLPTGLIANVPAAPQKIKIDKPSQDVSPLPYTIHDDPSAKSKKSCSTKSKHATDKDYICNPETGSWVKIGGSVYKKLLKKYTIDELQQYMK